MQHDPPPQDPLVGTIAAGRYRVLSRLGEGGMGQVYLAEHVAIEKRMALKVLRAEYAHKGEIVTRFQQEAISASRIKHPNVLDVFDFGRLDNGCFYLAMEFLEGNDLADEMKRHRTLDAPSAVRIALQVCRALGAAHAKGVVHRDLKPENVFLQRAHDGEETVKIVDFGIALLRTNEEEAAHSKQRRLTKTGMIFGTPEYMAPEQAAGKHADPRADIYALGVMLYEMFTGAVPFSAETFLGVLAKHLNDTPPPMTELAPDLAVSPQLQAIVFKALSKNPDDRFQSMAEFGQALSATPEGEYVLRGPPAPSGGSSSPAFLPPAPGNPTAPEFGVVRAAPAAAPATTNRAVQTRPAGSGEPERHAETQLSAESVAAAEPRGRSRTGALTLGLGILASASVAAFLLFGRTSTQQEPAGDPPQPPEARAPAADSEPVPQVATGEASLTGFTLSVATDPPGATLTKNGFQVCDSTPCDVRAEPNETLELEAVREGLKGRAKVLAQRDQKVSIRLLGNRPRPAPRPNSGAPRMCEVEVDGLKILRPCQ